MTRCAIHVFEASLVSFSVLSLSCLNVNFQRLRYGYSVDEQFPGNTESEDDVRTLSQIVRH